MVEQIREILLHKDKLRLLINLKKNIFDLVTLKGKNKYVNIQLFKTVHVINSGGSFGERALVRNEDRAASIVGTQKCKFATLDR
jgi:hypothetical protein